MMISDIYPKFGVDEMFLEYGIKAFIKWKYDSCPHCLVFGGTGTGKTYFVKSLLGSISMYVNNAKITVCDYKADDFKFLQGYNGYYAFDECMQGLTDFYNEFTLRQQGEDTSRDFRLLVFDEWASFLNNLDKKETENAKKKLTTLLILGRSFNFHVLVSQQRADAKYFDTARDNFSVIVAMGNISRESIQMFFSEYKEDIKNDRRQGTGYIYVNGNGLKWLNVPIVRNTNKLQQYIVKAVQ